MFKSPLLRNIYTHLSRSMNGRFGLRIYVGKLSAQCSRWVYILQDEYCKAINFVWPKIPAA